MNIWINNSFSMASVTVMFSAFTYNGESYLLNRCFICMAAFMMPSLVAQVKAAQVEATHLTTCLHPSVFPSRPSLPLPSCLCILTVWGRRNLPPSLPVSFLSIPPPFLLVYVYWLCQEGEGEGNRKQGGTGTGKEQQRGGLCPVTWRTRDGEAFVWLRVKTF